MLSKERFKQRRTEKNLSQTSFANYWNVTRTAYHHEYNKVHQRNHLFRHLKH